MTATAHALIAGAIASRFPQPITATILSFASHYVLDCVPHWDFGTNWRLRPKQITGILAIGETIIGICLASLIYRQTAAPITLATAIFASLLPDWLETPWYILFAKRDRKGPPPQAGLFERFTYRIYKIQNLFHTKTQLPIGLLTQVLTVGFFLFLLK